MQATFIDPNKNKFVRAAVQLGTCFLLSACSASLIGGKDATLNTSLSGLAPEFTQFGGLASVGSAHRAARSLAVSTSCPSGATAELHALAANGTLLPAALTTSTIDLSSGSYSFAAADLSSDKISVNSSAGVQYFIIAKGCGLYFSRPVTALAQQSIDYGSHLISFMSNVLGSPIPFSQVNRANLDAFLTAISALKPGDANVAYQDILASSSLRNQFQSLFGQSPTALQNTAPMIETVLAPTGTNEGATANFQVALHHWNAEYSPAYQWKNNGASATGTSRYAYAVGKNDQGAHSISLTAGSDDGSGAIDASQATSSVTFSLVVANTYPATPPVLSMVSPASLSPTQRNITVGIATGASLTNCSTFSSLALVESNSSVAPSAASFNLACLTAGVQSQALTLSAGNGTKTLQLWAMDAGGNISSTPSTLSLAFNQVGPDLTLDSTALLNNAATATLSGSCDPNGQTIVVTGADSGTATCIGGTSRFSYTTVSRNSDATRTYTFTQSNLTTGNSTTVSGTWQRDTVLPAVALTSLNAGGTFVGGAVQTITWTATDPTLAASPATPITLAYSTNGGTSNSWVNIATVANSGSYAWTLPSINSTDVVVRVTALDAAGNSNSAVSATPFSVDSNPPNLTLTSLNNGGLFAGGSVQTVTWSATSSFLGSNPISIDYSTDGGTTWSNVANGVAYTSGASGSYAWTLPSINQTNVKVRVTVTDQFNFAQTAISSNAFGIDSTAPGVSLIAPAGGSYIAGSGASTTIRWSATDTNFSGTPIKLEYSADSGTTWTTITNATANSGNFSWATTGLADGTHYRVRVTAVDLVGHSTPVADSSDFNITSNIPNLTQTTLASPYVTGIGSTTVTFGGVCDLDNTMTNTTITVGGTDAGATTTCNGTSPTGTWSYQTLPQNNASGGSFTYTFSQTNSASLTNTISTQWVRDTTAPVVSSVVINNGATYLNTTLATVTVTASDDLTSSLGAGLRVRVASTTATDAAGDGTNCQALYADNNWNTQTNATESYSLLVPDGDGYKKICAWAKDGAGNVSVISGVGALGTDMSVIQYANSSPPTITAFSVNNPSDGTTNYANNATVSISWSANDALGLDNNPVILDYTTDGSTWQSIVSGYGSLSGNPTTYTHTYLGFNAPSAGFFRVRIRVKNVTGQTSPAVLSGVQNAGQWSVYAGTTDRGIGGAARSAVFLKGDGVRKNAFVFDPTNGDMYGFDDNNGGVLRVDGHTGLVSQFIGYGPTNLPTSTTTPAAMPATPLLGSGTGTLAMDHNRNLYIGETNVSRTYGSARIFQINLNNNQVRLYAGGGNGSDASASPTSIYVNSTDYEFDESNSLYFFTTCGTPFYLNTATIRTNLMKLTQNGDGSAGTLSVVAGNCTSGAPVSGTTATNTPISGYGDNLFNSIAVWNNGNVIYYSDSFGTYKIINGTLYSTGLGGALGLTYSPFNNEIYFITGNTLQTYSVNTAGAGGETLQATIVGSGGTGACDSDGISASSTCANLYGGITINSTGQVFFGTGGVNAPCRIRYVDSGGLLRTYAGSLPFYGSGLDKSLIRGQFTGIYYKQASESNQTAFPTGLYFLEGGGAILGYVDDTTGIAQAIGGNQTGQVPGVYGTGTLINTTTTLGTLQGGAMEAMTFDDQGLPWFVYYGTESVLVSLDANHEVVPRQLGGQLMDHASLSTSPANTYSYYMLNNNLYAHDQKVFQINRYYDGIAYATTDSLIRIFDFGAETITQILGNGVSTSAEAGDTTSVGPLDTLSLSNFCQFNNCRIQYIAASVQYPGADLLYFVDGSAGTTLRFITNPTTPASSLLTTAFDAGRYIQNFILSLDETQVFYESGGILYCHTLSGTAKSWCNDMSLGPPAGLHTLGFGSNSFSWKNASALMISDGQGDIYEYTLLP